MVLITFIIPTIGRSSLILTLNSLINMKNKNWNCIIVFDGINESQINGEIKNLVEKDDRFEIKFIEKKLGNGINGGGEVRNYGIRFVKTDWIGFVDDDDILEDCYICKFYEELEKNPFLDLIIFKMSFPLFEHKKIVPNFGETDIVYGNVGISFCVKKDVLTKNNIYFENGEYEDFNLLNSIKNTGSKFILSDHLTYRVRNFREGILATLSNSISENEFLNYDLSTYNIIIKEAIYGAESNYIDVREKFENYVNNVGKKINIGGSDYNNLFGDPAPYVLKKFYYKIELY